MSFKIQDVAKAFPLVLCSPTYTLTPENLSEIVQENATLISFVVVVVETKPQSVAHAALELTM